MLRFVSSDSEAPELGVRFRFVRGTARPYRRTLHSRFHLRARHLSQLDDQTLRVRALTDLTRVALVVLQRWRDSQDPGAILRPWARTLRAVLSAPHGREALQLVARYTAEVSDAEPEFVYRFFIDLGPEAEEIFMSTADRLRGQHDT